MSDEKELPAPSVARQLEQVERVIARDQKLEAEVRDPLALEPEDKRNQVMAESQRQDMQMSLKHPEVRRVLNRIIEAGGLMDADSDPNATVMAHHVGARWLALEVFNMIEDADPSAYWQMRREHRSNLKSKEKNA